MTQGKKHSPHGAGAHGKPVKKGRIGDNLLFMRKFFRHGIKIASVWPSSRAMSRETCRQIDWDTAQVVIELGAGTGAITGVAISRLQPHTRFIAIERDADFVKILRHRFADLPNVEIVEGDVRDLEKILKSRNINKVDGFVSGLPTPSLPPAVRRRMLVSVRRYLSPAGVYSNITEFPFVYMRYYKSVFRNVKFELVVRNMPPGGVYHCRAMR